MSNNTLLASDDFASGSLAAGWSAIFGLAKCQVVGAVAEPVTTGTTYGQIWTGLTFPNDQISECTVGSTFTQEGNTYITLCVRYQTGVASGYEAAFSNSGLTIYRTTAGSSTVLTSVAGQVFSAGDILTFSAAGAALSVYQNNKRLLYWADATYTSGAPGFKQFTTTNITHTQVAKWRGYSAVQQDGIWQKQGIAIPASAADLASSGFGNYTNSKVLYEGNAQILSGTVYKTWVSAGPFNSSSRIFYAESLDGVTWSRQALPTLDGYCTPGVIKNGSTYYLYAQQGNQASSGNFNLFTSTDGITWTLQSSTIIGLGGVGTWDRTFIWSFNPVAIIGGTWYALYSAGSDATTYQFSVGLATSPDGLIWTKYASNPVIANGYVGQSTLNVSGKWYTWVATSQPGQNQVQPNIDPAQTIRYESTDLITWTNPQHSLSVSQLHEAVNTVNGQCYPNAIIDIGGRAYVYTTSSLSDNVSPKWFQIGLAIAPGSIASVVTQPERATVQIASENFSGGAGDLSANWTTPAGSTKLQKTAGGLVEPSATNTSCAQYYSGASFSANQYSEITLQTAAGGSTNAVEPIVRGQPSGVNWYSVNIVGPTGSLFTSFRIQKVVNGTTTAIGPTQTITPAVGDVFRLEAVGNVLSAYQNGFLIQQVVDQNNTFPSGSIGLTAFAQSAVTNAQASLWAGGNTAVIPSSGTSGTDDDMLNLNRWCTRLWG